MGYPTKKASADHGRYDRPIQDEWGIFDPEQAGLAAVLRKLNELAPVRTSAPPSTNTTKPPAPRR